MGPALAGRVLQGVREPGEAHRWECVVARALRQHGELIVDRQGRLLAGQRGGLERDCAVPKAAQVLGGDAEHRAKPAAAEGRPGARLRQGGLGKDCRSWCVRAVGRLRGTALFLD